MSNTIRVLWLATAVILVSSLSAEEPDRLPLGKSPYRTQLSALEAEKIMLTDIGRVVGMNALVEKALPMDVIIIGEFHDNYAVHKFQADFITALFSRFPKLAVGFEFFERGHDEFLELWRTGKVSEAELVQKTGWYRRSSLNFGYTRLILDILQKHAIKAVGLNVPRDLIRRVSQKGFASLEPAEKKLFPGWEITDPEHELYIRGTFGPAAVQNAQWFGMVYGAQKCWDVIMAESMRLWLVKKELHGYKGVIIAGSGHVAYGLGIPFRYRLRDKKARLFSIMPVYVGKKEGAAAEENPMLRMLAENLKPAAIFSRGIADAVLSLAVQEKPHFPVIGFSGKMTAEGYEVTDVTKAGLAEKWGIRKGDVIFAADGQKLSSEEELRAILAKKKWDDAVIFDLKKKAEFK